MVPLMMPAIHWMRLAVRPSRSALMMGMPPATAASKATITPLADAAAKSRCRARPAAPCCDHMLARRDGSEHQGAGD